MSASGLALLWSGLTVGNFLYQVLGNGAYSVAIDRSYFQAAALISVWVAQKWSAA